MKKNIAIAGLGWLGQPLFQRLELLGYTVKGSVTSITKATTLQKKGVDAYPVKITEEGITGEVQGFLKNVATLIVMIPPGLRGHTGADYVLKMSRFLSAIEDSNVANVVFISSTSVYGSLQGKVTEKTIPKPDTEAGRQLFQVEQLFFSSKKFKTSIVRFGGLVGGNRQPVKYLAGRTGLNGGNDPVNLIHRSDCIAIIKAIITKDAFGHVFHGVHPEHPKKEIYYKEKATELGLEAPNFAETTEPSGKQIDSELIAKILRFEFKVIP